MSDPTAQMGIQVGQTALKHGTDYMEQNVSYQPFQKQDVANYLDSLIAMSTSRRSNIISTSRMDTWLTNYSSFCSRGDTSRGRGNSP
jgi:hypothetical protein